MPVRKLSMLVRNGANVFFLRNGLARQCRSFGFERHALNKPHIGGDDVARFEQNNIALYKRRRCYSFYFAVAPDFAKRRAHVFERRHCFFRFTLLHSADNGVEQNYKQYNTDVDKVLVLPFDNADNGGNYGRRYKNYYHYVGKLLEKFNRNALLFSFRELVLAARNKAHCRIAVRQTALGDGQIRKNLGGRFVKVFQSSLLSG